MNQVKPLGFFFSRNRLQNALGSLHNIDFGVFWVSWGGSGKEAVPGTGSGFRWVETGFAVPRKQVQDTKVPGSSGCVPEGSKVSVFDGSGGLDGTGSGKVPGSGDSVPKVPNVTFYFERALLYFEIILVYFESILLYFESILLYFERILLL